MLILKIPSDRTGRWARKQVAVQFVVELELMEILTWYVVCRAENLEIESEVERWNGGREKARLAICEKSSIEHLTRRCSKGSLRQRGNDL